MVTTLRGLCDQMLGEGQGKSFRWLGGVLRCLQALRTGSRPVGFEGGR